MHEIIVKFQGLTRTSTRDKVSGDGTYYYSSECAHSHMTVSLNTVITQLFYMSPLGADGSGVDAYVIDT